MRPAKDWTTPTNGDAHDQVLWVSFRKGSREALEKLYLKHVSGMYHHGMFVCRDPDVVRDGMQELFSRLWSARTRITNADCVQGYLYKSLQRIILVQVTRKRRQYQALEEEDHIVDLSDTVEQVCIDREFRKEQIVRIRKALEMLPKHQREVVLLRFFNGLRYPQIAEIMDIHIESVYNLSSRAIEQLRARLQFSPLAQS